MNEAMLKMGGTRPVVRFERHLASPPDVVWRALTDPEELKAWFPHDVIVDEWKVGATLTFPFREVDWPDLKGTVLVYDPPGVLAYTWGDETLRFELSSEPNGGTHLIFTDELDRQFAARNAAGWEECFERLEGHAASSTEWMVRFDRYVGAFAPTLGPQEGPPPGWDAS